MANWTLVYTLNPTLIYTLPSFEIGCFWRPTIVNKMGNNKYLCFVGGCANELKWTPKSTFYQVSSSLFWGTAGGWVQFHFVFGVACRSVVGLWIFQLWLHLRTKKRANIWEIIGQSPIFGSALELRVELP